MRLLTVICFVSFSIFSSQSAFAQAGIKQQSADDSQFMHTIKSAVLNEERTVVVHFETKIEKSWRIKGRVI